MFTELCSFITTKGAYDRNHGPIPYLSAESHIVQVDGLVRTQLSLSVAQLQNDFQQHEVTCALQCAGNRRHTMQTLLKEVQGIDWGDGAVMNCTWKGPRLQDVLLKAGVNVPSKPGATSSPKGHVAFACFQVECQDDKWYGGSIELPRAMREDHDVILALEMNGKPLSPQHGFPVRVIVPGIAGARSVKWLDRITVQMEESQNHYQTHDYKVLPPDAIDAETAQKFWDITPAIQDMPINSVIAKPESGENVELSKDGTVTVEGYALPQGDQGPVVRVEVSADDGQSWLDADLHQGNGQKWCWVLWRANVRLERGKRRLLSRAIDKGGNVQEECPKWNLRGVCYNGYGESRDVEVV